jgi:LAO/AO transport system kinase
VTASDRSELSPEALRLALVAGDRAALARAITLIESSRPDHQNGARELIQELLPRTGSAVRVGITGTPGVGKSTTIDALGTLLTGAGHKVAVLTVDPSSSRSGGSILGDKTRMARLAADPNAFIRPSPSGGALGGVAARTRETLLLCEAAGYDVVIVETVGTGQSEISVAHMTDCFVVLMLAGGGDELQGIKKGVLEVADILAVNKADGDNVARAQAAAAEYKAAFHILTPASQDWMPPVLTCSALTGSGLAELWQTVLDRRDAGVASGTLAQRRREQQVRWMWTMLEARVLQRLHDDAGVRERLPALERAVADGALSPAMAVEELSEAIGLSPAPEAPARDGGSGS